MATVTIAEGARRLRGLWFKLEQIALREAQLGLVRARRRATTVYMLRGPKDAAPNPSKLTIRTGALARSVKVVPARRLNDMIVGGLEAGGLNVPYAAIHEFGGRTRAHTIEPLKGVALRWRGIGPALPPSSSRGRARIALVNQGKLAAGAGGFFVFAKMVHHPGSNIPARPYMTPSLNDELPSIREGIEAGWAALGRSL